MIAYGHIAFYGSFYLRNHGEALAALSVRLTETTGIELGPIGFIGTALGLLIGIFGAVGTWLGGALTDRYGPRDARAYILIPAFGAAISLLPFFWAMLTGSVVISLSVLALPILLTSLWYGPIFATVQSLVQPRTRATASAVMLFVINLVGLGFGPVLVGIFSDVFAISLGEADGLRWSLLTMALTGTIALVCFLMASRSLREEIVS